MPYVCTWDGFAVHDLISTLQCIGSFYGGKIWFLICNHINGRYGTTYPQVHFYQGVTYVLVNQIFDRYKFSYYIAGARIWNWVMQLTMYTTNKTELDGIFFFIYEMVMNVVFFVTGRSPGGVTNNMLTTCAGCEKPILDKFLSNVSERPWHVNCVRCFDCGQALNDKCLSREGKLFCRDDFFKWVM